MGKYKTKAIQADAYSRIFRNIQAYSEISRHNQAYSEPYVTLTCSQLLYIQNPARHIQSQRHIQNPGISKTLAHSEPETY